MRLRTLASALAVALVTTVLVTLSFAGSADAATMRTWQRLANCESGGRWHINTHNGYYGGLQISSGTWRAYGGKRFARDAHAATRTEQVTVANRIKNRQGWGAWPSCSRRIGVR